MVAGKFVVISTAGHSLSQLSYIATALRRFSDYVERTHGTQPAIWYTVVYLVAGMDNIKRFARQCHGLDLNPATIGYSFESDHSVVAAVGTERVQPPLGTLLHEYVHVAVRVDFGDIPPWLDEGIASLYEETKIVGDDFIPQPNWRGRFLREHPETLVPLEVLIGASPRPSDVEYRDSGVPFEDQHPMLAVKEAGRWATARYFMLYLHSRRMIAPVYMAFSDVNWASVEALGSTRAWAIQTVGKALGMDIGSMENDFRDWLRREHGIYPGAPR